MALDSVLLARAVRVAIGLVLLAAAFEYVLLPALVARFRQNIFILRRELFLVMADGGIAANDPVYLRMRQTMNGMLRFAERVSLLRVVVTFAMMRRHELNDDPTLAEMIARVSDTTARERLTKLHDRLGLNMVEHALLSSPLGWLVFLLAMVSVIVESLKGMPLAAYKRRVGKKAEPIAEALSGSCDTALAA